MHSHHCYDSITVCEECGVTLKMVNAFQNASLFTWADALDCYDEGSIYKVEGVGRVTISKILDMKVTGV